MSENDRQQTKDHREERYAESTNLQYGVVEANIPEDDIYRSDENHVFITQHSDGVYWLHAGSCVRLGSTIMFDSVRWEAGEHQGTLWFSRTVDGDEITTGNLDWHAVFPRRELGLVGEWFLDQIDLSEYRAGVDCPKCGDEALYLPMATACARADCDFYVEGRLQEGDSDD